MNDRYLLDSSVFIQSKNTHYSFDIAPSFWSKLNILANDGAFAIIDKVYDELTIGKDNPDDLCSWIMEDYKGKVLSTEDEKVLSKYKDIQDSIKDNSQYRQSAKDEFALYENADAWLVAYAAVYNYKVVTSEKYEPNRINKIKIPNVCEKFGVEYINLFDFMRNVKLTL